MTPPTAVPSTPPAPLRPGQRGFVLLIAFLGLVGAGFQLGLMPLAALSVSREMLGDRFAPGLAGDWFARYTAALMLGAAVGGILLGSLGDRIGRARATGVCILCYSLFGAAGAWAQSQEQLLGLRVLAGLGVGGMWPNGVALVSECWSSATRPMVAGVIGTGLNVGILCVSQLGRMRAVTADSWRWLVELGAGAAVVGVVALFLLPESPRWLATRGAAAGPPAAPLRELFGPGLRRITVVGILLGAIPLVGAWAAGKWMIPWADAVGGRTEAGYKALTQGWWAAGAILGSFFGSHLAHGLGRRTAYFLISLGSVTLTCGIFVVSQPLAPSFLPLEFAQGQVTTLFFGWLPLCLPELFPTRVRATGTGIAYNTGRFASAAGALGAGALMAWSGGDYARVGLISGLVYALGLVVIWWAPDTTKRG
ncbi:MAG: MFS transporter, partial [Opitutaceae bacterium]|nr:MFS transporter [Opitutaceae bacterium]